MLSDATVVPDMDSPTPAQPHHSGIPTKAHVNMLSTGPPQSAVSPSPGDASPENKDDKAAPVRKRLSLACTTCRQRKVKCDGGRPSCRTCAKFNWPCIYQPSNRKRGPRPRALALMDGSIPYSSRPHWAVSHSYYAYGYPGHSPLSPPPPPPPPPLHFAVPHNPDLPLNGAPMQVDPARHQPGSYNHDAYSTYGDFVANTGVIRIRPPPIHGPAFNHPSPTSMYMHRDTQSHHHPYHGHSYRIGHGNSHQMPAPGTFDARPTSPVPPLSAQDSTLCYLDCPAPSNMSPQYSHSHRYPPHHSPMLMSPIPPGLHAPDELCRNPPLPTGTGAVSATDPAFGQAIVPQDAPPSISSVVQHHPLRSSAWASELPGRAQPLDAPPALRSTPPQHMQQPAQSHSCAPPYAMDMPPSKGISAVALAQPPAIYARRKADTPPTADCSNNSGSGSGFQTQPAPADQHQHQHQHQHLLHRNRLPLLQSPRLVYDSGQAQSPLTSPMSYDLCHTEHRKQHQLHSLGDIDCHAPRHASSERAMTTACVLPFSDGVARPRLPPLSEILGNDYQMIALSPNGAHTSTDVLPAFGGAAPDHFALPLSRRKDSFRDEVSKMLAHDGLH
ncbi:hypothetical protein IWW37_000899 [Coemansia sp. RSA 2050]|nr:hypothetical protein IWW37_000899 [Coemansia sp. RSA 2050]